VSTELTVRTERCARTWQESAEVIAADRGACGPGRTEREADDGHGGLDGHAQTAETHRGAPVGGEQ